MQHHIAQLVAALQLPKEKQIIPDFTSYFVFEFYQKAAAFGATDYSRSNYFVKIYFNDYPIKIPSVCQDNYQCQWDLFQDYVRSRQFKDTITGNNITDLQTFCA